MKLCILCSPQEEAAEGSAAAEDAEQQALVLAPPRAGAEAEDEERPSASVAGGAIDVDEADEAAVCGALFKGLVFFMGCAPPFGVLFTCPHQSCVTWC